jgi:hypothetical protein
MLNNTKLKEILSQKMTANTTESTHAPTSSAAEPSGSDPMSPSLSVVLTFSLSLAEAPSQMKRIQELVKMLGLQSAVQQQLEPLPLKSSQTVPRSASLQPTTPARSQSLAKLPTSTAMMTDKQKRMIFTLIARKNLSPESVSDIMESEFGHTDETKLNKIEASKLIDKLMSDK